MRPWQCNNGHNFELVTKRNGLVKNNKCVACTTFKALVLILVWAVWFFFYVLPSQHTRLTFSSLLPDTGTSLGGGPPMYHSCLCYQEALRYTGTGCMWSHDYHSRSPTGSFTQIAIVAIASRDEGRGPVLKLVEEAGWWEAASCELVLRNVPSCCLKQLVAGVGFAILGAKVAGSLGSDVPGRYVQRWGCWRSPWCLLQLRWGSETLSSTAERPALGLG